MENNLYDGKENGFAICLKTFEWIKKKLKENSTILELGSGYGTIELCKYYNVYSVEHNKNFLNLSKSNYIYAPFPKNYSWYNRIDLENKLPKKYDLLLIDGPPGKDRINILNNLDLFDLENPIILVDDINRHDDMKILMEISKICNRKYEIFDGILKKKFGIIK